MLEAGKRYKTLDGFLSSRLVKTQNGLFTGGFRSIGVYDVFWNKTGKAVSQSELKPDIFDLVEEVTELS